MTGRQRRILEALARGSCDVWQLGADLVEAPFVVRGELGAMERLELVVDHWQPPGIAGAGGRHVWRIAPAGERALDQGVLL